MGDSIFIRTAICGAFALGLAVAPASAQESVDEVIVTGSYIKHTPEDAPVPVNVIDSEELINIGNPSVVELVKTLGVSSGVDGETNQFQSNGLDLAASYTMPAMNGDLEFSLQWTHIASFDVGASDLSEGFDAGGKLNDTVSFLRPVVDNKGKLGIKYVRNVHTFNFVTNYMDSYRDADSIVGVSLSALFPNTNIREDVEDHMTYDLHYNLSLADFNDALEESAVWVSVYNLTDEDPPRSRTDLNYDPYTHNPFGQMIKVGVRHRF